MQRDMGDLLEQIDADAERMTGLNLDRFTGAAQRRVEGAPDAGPAHELDLDAIRADLLDDADVERAVEVLWPRLVPGELVQALLTNAGSLAEHLPRLTAQERSLLLRGPDDPWTDADVPLLDEAASLLDGPRADVRARRRRRGAGTDRHAVADDRPPLPGKGDDAGG